MGDWGIATWWGTGSPPRLPDRLGEDDRWAVRLGRVGYGGLWQMDTLSKWGVRSPTLRGHSQVVGVLPAADEVFTRGQGPLVAGFNYLVERAVPRRTAGRRGQAPDLLAGAADLLGAGSAAVVEDEGHPMLCLSQPVVIPTPVVEWPLDQLHRQPESARALFEALALAAPRGPHITRFLIGLWTAEYGYLHTGELTLDLLSHAYDCSGAAQIELTGIHQRLHGETRSGPWAHSDYFQFTPAATPTRPWPLSPGPRVGSH
ncbi:hypothetical protein [Streptomyces atratus]|uniref:Uncharacterized protein n=1 Tax=Streptomyces atratus TaxID=1893 RepID=A0A2Z5JNL2_STRAR|nr:hypothetical protein [Streptomyces atratus]AXE82040.1 hypothetical protein C5746_39805 [Streptomyces atratus]